MITGVSRNSYWPCAVCTHQAGHKWVNIRVSECFGNCLEKLVNDLTLRFCWLWYSFLFLAHTCSLCTVAQQQRKSFLAAFSWADSLSLLSWIPGIEVPFVRNTGLEEPLPLWMCVGCVPKWHQDDNYYNYVLIQLQHCGFVSVSCIIVGLQTG